MSENRIEERVRPGIELRLYDRTTKELIGLLVDFSTRGIRIKCEEPVQVDAVLQCTLQVPLPANPSGAINFDARRVWCQPSWDSDLFEAGFELVKVNHEEMKRLKQVMLETTGELKTPKQP